MNKVWKASGIIQNRVEQLSIVRHEADMIRTILLPGKCCMSALMVALKDS